MDAFKYNLKKVNEGLKATNEELKKNKELIKEMKKKMDDKDTINKLHIERMGKLE